MSGGGGHGGGEHAGGGEKKGGGKKKLIIIAAIVTALAGGGAFAAFKTGMLGHKDPAVEEAKVAGEGEEGKHEEGGKEGEGDKEGHKAETEEAGGHESKEGHGEKDEKKGEKEDDGGHGGGGKKAKKKSKGEGELAGPFYFDLQEFVVNLDVGSASPSFLKMTVSLELPSELDSPKIDAALPRIRDSFYVYIRELRREDLRGSQGVYRLREELLLRINKIVAPAKVNDILFKEILIQ